MPTKRAPKSAKNQPQPFKQTLAPTLPLTPILTVSGPSRRTIITISGIVAAALLSGVLAGFALRALVVETMIVSPGSVAAVTNPQYIRIAQAKAVAATTPQTIQITGNVTQLQAARTVTALQLGGDINQLQPGLSAYDAQGSVDGPSRQ